MNLDKVIEHFGGLTKTAAALSVTEQTIRNWIKANEIPRMAQLAIETLTKNKIKANDNEGANHGN